MGIIVESVRADHASKIQSAQAHHAELLQELDRRMDEIVDSLVKSIRATYGLYGWTHRSAYAELPHKFAPIVRSRKARRSIWRAMRKVTWRTGGVMLTYDGHPSAGGVGIHVTIWFPDI
jgi:hypothetical protein